MKIILKLMFVFFLMVLLLSTFFSVNAAQKIQQPPRAHPVLIHMAAESPLQTVAVIVQKSAPTSLAERKISTLGGKITKNLNIIHALAAEMTAGAAIELARDPGVAWVSLDAPMVKSECNQCVDTGNLKNAYIPSIGADQLWNEKPYLQGEGVTVAIVDSGISPHLDFKYSGKNRFRVLKWVNLNSNSRNAYDWYGHGTHIAGIIGGNGEASHGSYIGVAPEVNLVTVKVSDDRGSSSTSDVIAGLEWVYEHQQEYKIQVVNLSLNSTLAESYHTSPIDAALEILWFKGVVVVVSAGNSMDGALYPPANDPFVITVGATDDQGTASIDDDLLASFSAAGVIENDLVKPEIVAPGSNIVSVVPWICRLNLEHPDHRLGWQYFRMSGTSMASAVTTGAVALLLQADPQLNPDQVKQRLMITAHPFGNGAGAGYLDIFSAVHGTSTETANTGLPASQLLWTGNDPVNWDSVNWGSVNWGSVNWGSVNWGSVNWGSVNWGSDYWGP